MKKLIEIDIPEEMVEHIEELAVVVKLVYSEDDDLDDRLWRISRDAIRSGSADYWSGCMSGGPIQDGPNAGKVYGHYRKDIYIDIDELKDAE